MKDTIERADAIAALDDEITITGTANASVVKDYVQRVLRKLRDLPSAQPEIIRCKECKHSEHWYKDKRRCFLWHETGIDVFEDGYCNYAEGKEE